jgi:uncharacterized membrane protein
VNDAADATHREPPPTRQRPHDMDVSADIDIAAAPADIAGIMFDPARDADWMNAVTSVDVIDPALEPGARVRRTGRFLGKTFTWTTQVESVHFPHLLALRIVDGPFTGTMRYDIQRAGAGSRVRIRNVGQAGALSLMPDAFVAGPMRRALEEDLARLKVIVEASGPAA